MIRWMLTAVAMTVAGAALAKLPPPDEAAKAKAAEAAAKSAWQGKVDNFLLCKAQDRVAAYVKAHPKPAAAGATPVVAAPAAGGAPPAVATAPAGAAPVAVTNPTSASPTTASQGGSTPVATVGTPATAGAATAAATIGTCADPGPFTVAAPAPASQKPLEASGAHSPAATAASPPSVRAESGSMTSGKTGGTPKP